jgi:hypothetical protein
MKKWDMSVAWQPASDFIIRCVEELFAPSNSGNPMITLKFEVASPEEMDVAGEKYNIAGTPISFWQVVQTMDGDVVDAEKTAENLKRLKALYAAFELPNDNINPENPAMGFKGKIVYALLENNQQAKRKSPTAEQLKAGQKQGDIMINPLTKQPLVTNYPKITEIFGLAPVASGTPY